jgi:phage tail-like protein
MADSSVRNSGLNYVTANRFYVEIESTITACFTECSGLGVQIKYDKLLEGGVNEQQRVLLGRAEFSEVTLKRGLSDDLVFWDWISEKLLQRNKTTKIKQSRRNINILTFNQAGECMQCWMLIGAVPVSWKAPSLAADSGSTAIEELTLIYEGLQVTSKGNGGGALSVQRDDSGYFSSN